MDRKRIERDCRKKTITILEGIRMKLRLYDALTDYEFIQNWINDERTHALWCANRIPYPMTFEKLQEVLEKDAQEWGGCAYVATEENGQPVGFFVLSINASDNSGFLKFVIVDKEMRGKGYGTQMLEMMLKYSIETLGVSTVQLNVFDVNDKAKRCYSNTGFVVDSITENVFVFKEETWGRCHMIISK